MPDADYYEFSPFLEVNDNKSLLAASLKGDPKKVSVPEFKIPKHLARHFNIQLGKHGPAD